MAEKATEKCGFVAVLGASNAGKSTLVNQMVGTKVSIVSPKVQTTRTRILGICMREEAQILLVDTPGIFNPRRRLDRAMVASAWSGARDADEVIVLVDAKRGFDGDTRDIVDRLMAESRKTILALNKIDLVRRDQLPALSRELFATGLFKEAFMISAVSGDGVRDLTAYLAERLPEGPWMYPGEQVSDMPEYLLTAEITREQLYRQLRRELPYAATVETESWENFNDGAIRIGQIIYIERSSQKGIVIGKRGNRIKSIREAAQKEMEELLGVSVHLFLFLKVKEDWGDDRERFDTWVLDFNA